LNSFAVTHTNTQTTSTSTPPASDVGVQDTNQEGMSFILYVIPLVPATHEATTTTSLALTSETDSNGICYSLDSNNKQSQMKFILLQFR